MSYIFLKNRPSSWDKVKEYIKLRRMFMELKIIDDTAESRIALIQCFNSVLLKHDDQFKIKSF